MGRCIPDLPTYPLILAHAGIQMAATARAA